MSITIIITLIITMISLYLMIKGFETVPVNVPLSLRKGKEVVKYPLALFSLQFTDESSTLPDNVQYYGKGSKLEINGLTIDSPMVYCSEKSSPSQYPFIINKKLKVIWEEKYNAAQNIYDYSRSYSKLTQSSRGAFLKWLADGKSTLYPIGHELLLLYIQNLEYRAMTTKEEQKEILMELIRVHNMQHTINGYNYVYAYATVMKELELLIAHLILITDYFSHDEQKVIFDLIISLPKESALYSSGCYLKLTSLNITNEQLALALYHSFSASRSNLPQKLGRSLFDYYLIMLSHLYNDAIDIKFSIDFLPTLYHYYRSYKLPLKFRKTRAYKLNFTNDEQRERFESLWLNCIEDMRPYSRKVDKCGDAELFFLLPAPLKPKYLHKIKEKFSTFIRDRLETPCPFEEVVEVLSYNLNKGKIKQDKSEEIATIIDECGFRIIPDARYMECCYKTGDKVIIIEENSRLHNNLINYKIGYHLLGLSLAVIKKPIDLHRKEIEIIKSYLLHCFTQPLMKEKELDSLLKLISEEELQYVPSYNTLAALLDKRSMQAIDNYLFDLTSYQDLYEKRQQRLTLDKEHLGKVIEETDRVKLLLNDVFCDNEQSSDNVKLEEKMEEPDSLEYVLSTDIEQFKREILTKNSWSRHELKSVAIKYKLMLDSTIEKINYWSELQSGDYLIYENEDNYIINENILGDIL